MMILQIIHRGIGILFDNVEITGQQKQFVGAQEDIYGDEEEEYFTILTQEIFDGVIDVWEAPYNYGIDRLRDVLQAAIQTPVNQCWLSKDTVWIGNSQKKGVCHVLVNEGRIDGWVKKDGETV